MLGVAVVINFGYVFFPSMELHFFGVVILFGCVFIQARELAIRGKLCRFFASGSYAVRTSTDRK